MSSQIIQTASLEEIDTRIARVFRREDDIVCVHTKDNVAINLVGSKESYNAVKSLANGGKVYLLSLSGSGATLTDKARDFWVAKKKNNPVVAEAVVAKSLAHKLMVNFAIKFLKSGRQMKMFTNEADAVKWLKQMEIDYNKS